MEFDTVTTNYLAKMNHMRFFNYLLTSHPHYHQIITVNNQIIKQYGRKSATGMRHQ